MKSLNISILGCGWLGLPLLRALIADGHTVSGSSRKPETLAAITVAGGKAYHIDLPDHLAATFMASADVLIITLPPRARKLGMAAAMESMSAALAPLTNGRTELPSSARVIFTSSTSVYGAETGVVTEKTGLDLFAAPSAMALTTTETRLAVAFPGFSCLRLAGLVGPGRHPGRFYGGRERRIPNADAPVNLVHLDDVISAIRLLMDRKCGNGATFNVAAAAHPAKGDFYTAAAEDIGLKVAGRDPGGADGKIVNSDKLRALGWQPVWDDLDLGYLIKS